MKLNKIFAVAGALLALTFGSAFAKKAVNENKLKVVTTIFPEYDWARQIIGDKADDVELTLLLQNGVDLHSYTPSVKDIAKISEADIFIYVGGDSDEWVDDVLKNVKNKNMKVINLVEALGDKVKEEEIVEGMEHKHDYGHDEHDHDHDAHEHEHGHDHDAHEHEHEAHEHSHDHDEEITEADIKPREVSEFAGEWQSLYPVLMTGALDEYVEFQAEKKSISVKDSRAEIEAKWNCGIKTIKIKGDEITLIYDNGKIESGSYKYAGFATKKNDQGKISSIRHKFSLVKGNGPKYVMLNDHGHEPVKSVEHFHIYFGNNNFDELVTTKSNPFFVDSKLDAKGCLANVMGHEKGHDHGHEAHEHEHHHEKDEHVWLSLRFAQELCSVICDALCEKDGKNAAAYKANLAAYNKKLADLDAKYIAAVKAGSKDTLLFGDRFPFRYMTEDYGLKYFAAFTGCSAESEASFNTIVFLAEKVNELNLQRVCQIESGNGKIAKTVISNSKNRKAKIVTFDSLQSTTKKQIKKGTTYLNAMEKNLDALKEALN